MQMRDDSISAEQRSAGQPGAEQSSAVHRAEQRSAVRDAKYLLAYLLPAAAFAGLYFRGVWSPGSFYLAFVIIPLLELVIPPNVENLPETEENQLAKSRFFDYLLYLNAPVLYGLLYYFATILKSGVALSGFELVGLTLNLGIMAGAIGINVAHELGHRPGRFDQLMARILLLPSLYLHFNIEHNRGHHKHVATDADPASARKGENIYAFWWRSVSGSYLNAWRIEAERLHKLGFPVWSWRNEMLQFQAIQLVWLGGIAFFFGWTVLLFAVLVAMGGILLLESVNYIEHYGLRRRLQASGRYEPVSPRHSWNSDHQLGRIFLYELTRHSDHHYKASRKYQVLRHMEESPQLPIGYPASIVLSLAPPLWFRMMDGRVPEVVE